MTITPTALLALPLITTGTESGLWGDEVNNGLTSYLDNVIAGTQTISGTQTAVTLSLTAGTNSATNIVQAGTGATGSAQYQVINCTGSPASLLTITVPASSKTYVVINATSTSQSVKIVGVGPTSGVTIASGEKAIIAWNGSDFVKISTTVTVTSFSAGTTGLTPSTATTGAVTLAGTLAIANGGTNATATPTAGGVPYGTGTAYAFTASGTSGQALLSNGSSAPTWGVLTGTGGGTGVNNGSNTITLGGSFTTSGAFTTTLTVTANTNVTLPTTGTLATLAGSETFTNKTLTNPTITAYLETAPSIANSSTAVTISLASGTVLSYTLTGNCTFTMPTATSGTSFIVKLIQDGTGARTATFTSVKWPGGHAPTITTTATTGLDILSFVCINSVWYGTAAQAFA